MVRFRGAREKGAMRFVECLGVSQEDTMEGALWRETLRRSLGSHDAAELVGGMCRGNDFRQETTRLHAISCTRSGWSSRTNNRVLHHDPSERELADKTAYGTRYVWTQQRKRGLSKNKALLLDITVANPCASSTLENAARHAGKHLANAVERKKISIGGRSPIPTPSFLSLCRLVVRLAQECMPSLRSSPSDE